MRHLFSQLAQSDDFKVLFVFSTVFHFCFVQSGALLQDVAFAYVDVKQFPTRPPMPREVLELCGKPKLAIIYDEFDELYFNDENAKKVVQSIYREYDSTKDILVHLMGSSAWLPHLVFKALPPRDILASLATDYYSAYNQCGSLNARRLLRLRFPGATNADDFHALVLHILRRRGWDAEKIVSAEGICHLLYFVTGGNAGRLELVFGRLEEVMKKGYGGDLSTLFQTTLWNYVELWTKDVDAMDSLGFSKFCEAMRIFKRESELIEGSVTIASLMDNPYQIIPQTVRICDEMDDISRVDPHVPTALEWITAYKNHGFLTGADSCLLPGCPFYVPLFCHGTDMVEREKISRDLKEKVKEKGEVITSEFLKLND